MLSALHSTLTPAFFGEYFKDLTLGAIVVVYFVVLFLTRPHVVKDEKAMARGRRATEAAEAAKVLAR